MRDFLGSPELVLPTVRWQGLIVQREFDDLDRMTQWRCTPTTALENRHRQGG